MKAHSERLHEAVYGALRLIEDSELNQAELARALTLAEELLAELRRVQELQA
jgi:hypothetical protein